MNDLDQARERISAIDTDMAKLFTERMRQAEIIAQYKRITDCRYMMKQPNRIL